MSVLTPLYLLGLGLLALPVIFHLVRRTPRQHVSFSSLMFLKPSPPRLTRRSRLEHLLLLLLRATALTLVAFAFSRPFFRESIQVDVPGWQKRTAILLDTSASLRRRGLWSEALSRVNDTLDGLGPAAPVGLFTFDDRLEVQVDLGSPSGSNRSVSSAAVVRERLETLAPGWGGTKLGSALVELADRLQAMTEDGQANFEIVLVSDLQEGSDLGALDLHEWPRDLRLRVEALGGKSGTNAGVEVLAERLDQPMEEGRRVRVVNDAASTGDEFRLAWEGPTTTPRGDSPGLQVPPGETRVIRLEQPESAPAADRLVLHGDDHDFDNTFFFVSATREEIMVLCIGLEETESVKTQVANSDPDKRVKGMRYYIERALSDDARRRVRTVFQTEDSPADERVNTLEEARLVIASGHLDETTLASIRRKVESGGRVLYVLGDAADAGTLATLLDDVTLRAEEASVPDYVMLSEIDFSHPVFRAFSDPRFSDFTRIRFWKYRHVLPGNSAGLRVVARFDSAHPAILQKEIGRGQILVLTSGWNPDDSQLARSSKFVPLVLSLLEHEDNSPTRTRFQVNESILLARRTDDAAPISVRKPDGTEERLPPGARRFEGADEPGIYRFTSGKKERQVAVNVAAAESKVRALEIDALARRGLGLDTHRESGEERRQLRDLELESSQELWKWLIVAALVTLMIETWMSGRLSRQPLTKGSQG